MSCERGFTDNPTNQQQTANPRAVAPHNALRMLEDDLEIAQDILKSSVERAADRLEAFEHILDFVEDAEDDKCVNVDKSSIESVRELHANVGEAIADAFEDFSWEIRKAWRDFKQAIARETA